MFRPCPGEAALTLSDGSGKSVPRDLYPLSLISNTPKPKLPPNFLPPFNVEKLGSSLNAHVLPKKINMSPKKEQFQKKKKEDKILANHHWCRGSGFFSLWNFLRGVTSCFFRDDFRSETLCSIWSCSSSFFKASNHPKTRWYHNWHFGIRRKRKPKIDWEIFVSWRAEKDFLKTERMDFFVKILKH